MRKLEYAIALLLCAAAVVLMPTPSSARGSVADGPLRKDFEEAKALYEGEMYGEAMDRFSTLSDDYGIDDAEAYRVLCAIHLRLPGYENIVSRFKESYPVSGFIPQINLAYALALFDEKDFEGASTLFETLSRHHVFRKQVPEFLFKRAYCDFELRNLDRALQRFKDLELRTYSDYTAPARYAIGYICYEQRNFKEAVEWLEKASEDHRFYGIADFYILESRFMLEEYERVKLDGPAILEKVSDDKKARTARLISEANLVLGDAAAAKKYLDESNRSLSPKSYSDFFYAGSVLFAVRDYQGAIDNYSMMRDRSDSLGQIANYNMGYSYIKTRNKVAAMAAFKDASMSDFDPKIKEDAYFNYAKLAFDLNNDSSVFHEYLRIYSDRSKGDRIYSYIALAALYNRDYEGAVEAYDNIDELDDDMRDNYMKANYLRAHELIGDGSYRGAVPYLKAAAYYSDRRTVFNQMARYWLAEAYYRSNMFAESESVFTELYNTAALYGMEESSLILYNIAYCNFKEEDYATAAKWFSEYLSSKTPRYRKEAFLRYGDCMFMLEKYADAVGAYESVMNGYPDPDDLYACYQAGISYGLAGDNAKKIRVLSAVKETSPDAALYDETMFELGRSYVKAGDDESAVGCFDILAAGAKDSTFMTRSYIELGMIYRNRSDNAKALQCYRKVVEDMPAGEYAESALLAIESIYKAENTPEEYLAYIESIGKSSLKSEDEKEMMIFNAAEQNYLSENYPKAITSIESYISRYPEGKMLPAAEFYMAESYRNLGQLETACDHYLKVMESGTGSYVEAATLNYAVLSYSLQKYTDALDAYSSLYETAALENNRFTASVGMMRSAYRAKDYEAAVRYAALLKSDERCDDDLGREADYVMAKSYLATSRREEAYGLLSGLAAHPETEEGAEAAYLVIQDAYDRGDFEAVENKVYTFSDSGTEYAYWLAKAFLVLGDTFVEKGDLEQAEATFESVAQGYSPQTGGSDDVTEGAAMRLGKLAELKASGAAGTAGTGL